MEEKIIREKNRTSMKKIANDDRQKLGQMRLETRDSRALGKFLKNKRRWRLWSCGAVEFVLACLGEEERNEIKTKFVTN